MGSTRGTECINIASIVQPECTPQGQQTAQGQTKNHRPWARLILCVYSQSNSSFGICENVKHNTGDFSACIVWF